MSISEHRRIVAFETAQHEVPNAVLVDLLLGAHLVEDAVEFVAAFVADDDFLG